MLGQLQFLVGLIAIGFDIAAIVYFCDWLGKTDWLMGHVYGPASSILTATWTAIAGLIAAAAWIALALIKKLRGSSVKSPKRDWRHIVQGVILLVLLAPAGLIAAVGISELPRAQRELQTQRVRD